MLHCELRWTSRHKKDHPSHLPPNKAINYLAKLVDQAITNEGVSINGVTFWCITEHKQKGFIFWAHPDYQCEGPWYDWVYYQHRKEGVCGATEIPAQFWCFVDLRMPIIVSGPDGDDCDLQNHLDGWVGDNGIYAVCTSMSKKPVPLVVSNATQWSSSKLCWTGKGDKEKEVEHTSSVILECGKRHKQTHAYSNQFLYLPCFGYQ